MGTNILKQMNSKVDCVKIVEVLLPIPVKSSYHYRLTEEQSLQSVVGKRVLVRFGKSKLYTGIATAVQEIRDEEHLSKLKFIEEILDEKSILDEKLLRLYKWIASYYCCSEGEVMKASVPARLKLSSQPIIRRVPSMQPVLKEMKDTEYALWEALELHPFLSLKQALDITELKAASLRKLLQGMQQKGWIELQEQVDAVYKSKTIRCVVLPESLQDKNALQEAFHSLSHSRKQEAVLALVTEAFHKQQQLTEKEIVDRLNISTSAIASLIKKKLIEIKEISVDRLSTDEQRGNKKNIVFTAEQSAAVEKIRTYFSNSPLKPVLLHGVTGSGKTHIYIELIRDCLEKGKQALYLLPEIGLTKQIIERVRAEFGEQVGVHHSRFNPNERVEIWQKTYSGAYRVVIGVRSAILLPFQELGLIVVDEEHDTSFKQQEPSPRYNARNVAIYYGAQHSIPVLLGSATPSLESYYNAQTGKYGLVEIHTRAAEAELPRVEPVDMRPEVANHLSTGQFSSVLIEQLREILEKEEQAILFKNRRGYSPFLQCTRCGHVPTCKYCDISLTYHKNKKYLRCHYCGYVDASTEQCSNCQQYSLRSEGIGTERLEEQLQEIFPKRRIARMDYDATRGKHGLDLLISQFEKKQIDVLVGTQMVTKGLDFENVTLAGVIDADTMLHYPDFRALEHAYQQLMQFSGRAGRSQKKGLVLVQTYEPQHLIFSFLQQPYKAFYENEIEHRKLLHYPPYSRLIQLEFRHPNQLFLEKETKRAVGMLREKLGDHVLGPEPPPIARLRNFYRQQALIKITGTMSGEGVRETLRETVRQYYKEAPTKSMRIVVDVDPLM